MKVSVIVLTYNQELTIGRTLDSILAQQTDFPFEIIIGEDASPSDNTCAICQSYADKYANIRLLDKAPNKGLLKNYHDCLKKCKGDYIACCAGDDWWHNPDKLQLQVDYMDNHPDTVLCYTNYDILMVATNQKKNDALQYDPQNSDNIIDKLLKGFFLPTLSIMYRRDMLQYINLMEYDLRGYKAEDLPMYLTMALYGKIDLINISTSTYSVEAGSLSNFYNTEKMESFMLNMRDIKLDFLTEHPDVSEITKEQIIELYDKILFNDAFSSCNHKMLRKYAKRIKNLSLIEKIKYVIFTIKPLYAIYEWKQKE